MHLGRTEDFKQDISAARNAPVAGIAQGTTVMTLDGELPVEHLSPGTRVITRDTGMAVLREVRTQTATIKSIKIKAGSLGHTRPQDDMVIGPDTLVHIRDWRAKALFGADVATVKAKRLLDGEFIAAQDACEVTVHELIFDTQHIIYADGLEVASAAV